MDVSSKKSPFIIQ